MATWTLHPSALEFNLNLEEAVKRHQTGNELVFPPENYYLYEDAPKNEIKNDGGEDHVENLDEEQNDPYGLRSGQPIARNMVENKTKLLIERNIYAYSHLHTYRLPLHDKDGYDDEHIDLGVLTAIPPSFIFFGKPGVGKTTLAVPLAKKLNAVLITPENVAQYYRSIKLPEGVKLINYEDGTLNSRTILALVLCRIFEMDVIHRGYVMDGFPIIHANDVSMEEQMQYIYSLPRKPDYVINIHMQDVDLFNRRKLQKFDPVTHTVFTKQQYMASEQQETTAALVDFKLLQSRKEAKTRVSDASKVTEQSRNSQDWDVGSEGTAEDERDGTEAQLEFKPLDHDILGRLVSRLEDRPFYIQRDLDAYKNLLPILQGFVDTFDTRKVIDLNGYTLPSVLFNKLGEFLAHFGITPSPIPVKLIVNKSVSPELLLAEDDEYGEEQPCIPYAESNEEPDWEVVERTVVIRGRVDPRFRWRTTAWKNLCPVALKYGRTVVGKPELAVGFMDRVYFMSSENAFKEFELNPRSFLLPPMPTSPVKFYVLGHPLSGKTLLANELAAYLGAYVIDMKREIRRKFHLVKQDHLFRIRLKAVFEIMKEVDTQNFIEWKRLERSRREELLAYIELLSQLKKPLERERRRTIIDARENSLTHGLGDTYSGTCQSGDGLLGFSYKEFKENWKEKRTLPHQKKLELAWKLWHEGKLKYKREKRKQLQLLADKYKKFNEEAGEDGDEGMTDGEETEPETEMEDSEEHKSPRRRKHKKFYYRKFCKPKEEKEEVLVSVDSSVFGPDDEPIQSILLRYPDLDIPSELANAHPRPATVTEKDPLVAKLVQHRMIEAEEWADALPPEIYVDILVRAVSEVEEAYLEENSRGPLSGGWIVDNLSSDLEQLKAIVRHPITAPDSVLVITDQTEDKAKLLRKLKETHILSRELKEKEKLSQVMENPMCYSRPIYGDIREGEARGEGENQPWNASIAGEDGEGRGVLRDMLSRTPKLAVIAEEKFCAEFDGEDWIGGWENIPVTSETLLQRKLPIDTLVEHLELEISSSLHSHQLRDKLRQISLRDSILDVSQREILEGWLDTFGIQIPPDPKTGDYAASPGPPPSSAVEPLSRKTSPPKSAPKKYKIRFPVPNFEEEWAKKKLNYELLSFPHEKFLKDREYEVLARVSTPSIGSDREKAEAYNLGFESDYLEVIGEHGDTLERIDTPLSLLAEDGWNTSQGVRIRNPSLKAQFMSQIRSFDEFWNMFIPILNKERLPFTGLGVMNEENVFENVKTLWKGLENRFLPEGRSLRAGDLKEEYEQWMDANKVWKWAPELIRGDTELTGEDEDEEDDSDYEGRTEDDELVKTMSKPEEYRKVLKKRESMRYFGDTYHYCPVTLKRKDLLRIGEPKYSARYLDRTYYLVDEDARTEFVQDPRKFLPTNEGPLKPPCPRICVTGSPGCGQEEIALQLSKTYNVYYINFRQRLHEILKVQMGKNVGPGMLPSVAHAESLLIGMGEIKGEGANSGESDDHKEDEDAAKLDELEFGGEGRKARRMSRYNDHSLRSLGILDPIQIAHCATTEIERLELMATRNWKNLTTMEQEIKEFLQYGRQLSDEVLDELLPMFWKAEPFKSQGFIMVGFPNTDRDVKFLVENLCIPEIVFVMESKPQTMNNRLLRKTVDEWFREHPGEKSKMKANLRGKPKKVNTSLVKRKLGKENRIAFMGDYLPLEESDEDESLKSKDRLYKDTTVAAMISRNLHHWHHIYSKHLPRLKMGLNSERVEWTPIHTDTSLIESKRLLKELLSDRFIHRQGLLEATYMLSLPEAEVLLRKSYFHLSKFGRACPVEVYKGNTAVNLWHAPEVQKFPILYRGFVYFLAGAENAKSFRLDPYSYIQNPPQTPVAPLYVVVLGNSKSGKTELCQRLAKKLGLVYVSAKTMTEDIIQNALALEQESVGAVAVAAEGSSMFLAQEVLAYLRSGQILPPYISYRILDLTFLEPRSQFHGVVFDDYPLGDVQLQELLERGIVPNVVINLKMNPSEGHRRAEAMRFNPKYNYCDLLPDSNDFMNYDSEDYESLTKDSLDWFAEETQCLLTLDAEQSPAAIFNQARDRCCATMTKVQKYIYAGLKGLPCRIDSLSPLTSLICGKLSRAFGSYDPVALNDREELVKVKDLTDLSRIVEYRRELYVFSKDENVVAFLGNVEAYTLPFCKRVPPEDIPTSCVLKDVQMLMLRESWGFMDFDPVLYYEGNLNTKWLQTGNPNYCVEYRSQFYFFTSSDTMEKFMKKPQTYASIPIPTKLPGKSESRPLNSNALSPAGYLIASGLANEVARMLDTVARTRPKFPFMSSTKSSLLYLGYHLKTLNMKSSLDVRTHYRKAMMHMIRTQGNARDLIQEVKQIHGKQYIPEDTKRRISLFVGLADLPDAEKVLDPYIPGLNLNYETLFDEPKGMNPGNLKGPPVIPMAPYMSKNRLM